MELDKWQKQVLETDGNIILRSGRQCGKSTIIAVKVGEYASKHANESVMVVSSTERQAYLLFSKILSYLLDNHKLLIKKPYSRNVTKSQIVLINGTIIRCLPTGLDGLGIRGYTVNLLVADEAAFIPEEVWSAIIPMLATTGGNLILLSTPKGISNFFYRVWQADNKYTKFHVDAEEVAETRKEPQRTNMLEHQNEKKREMTSAEYLQEYRGEFVESLMQFFPDELIKRCMTLERPNSIIKGKDYFLGVDVARMGGDENAYEVLLKSGEMLFHVEHQIMTRVYLNEVTNHILGMDRLYDFGKIYIDDEGLGVGVFDYLVENDQTKRKVVSINNSKRVIAHDWSRPSKKKLLKEDLYNNLLRLMEQKKIQFLKDPEIFMSLKSVQYEHFTSGVFSGNLKIFGNYTHITEGLIRAAWCVKEKNLSIRVDYI